MTPKTESKSSAQARIRPLASSDTNSWVFFRLYWCKRRRRKNFALVWYVWWRNI